jgi:hypothetical protein
MYLVIVYHGVDPEIHGPFQTREARDQRVREDYDPEHVYIKLFLESGEPTVEPYSHEEMTALIGAEQ